MALPAPASRRFRGWPCRPCSARRTSSTPSVRPSAATAARSADVRPDDLGAVVIRELVRRTGADPAAIDDVLLGCANQAGEDNRNVARMSALLAGLPAVGAGRDRQPPVRLGPDGGQRRRAGHRRRRRRSADRGRRRVDVARAAGDAQAAPGLSARRRHDGRQHARLALRQSADGGPLRHARAGRDRRAGRREVRGHARGAGRLRAGEPAPLGGRAGRGALRRRALRRRAARRGQAPSARKAGTPAPAPLRGRRASRAPRPPPRSWRRCARRFARSAAR